jgi:hypothetical protein
MRKQIKKLKIKTGKDGVCKIKLKLQPNEDGHLKDFCEQAVADYRPGCVVTDLEKYKKVDQKFEHNLFKLIKGSQYSELNPEYVAEKDKYRVYGQTYNHYDYCLSEDDVEGVYVFCEYFENNAIVRACVAQLQAWYEDETNMNDTALIRLLCSLSYHWD